MPDDRAGTYVDKKKKMNWGRSIILAFVLFIAFIATLVTVCVRQDINLVTKDYYREELQYQKQIDRLTHTAALKSKPTIELEQGLLKINYTDFPLVQEGALELFRPSDPSHDKVFSLTRSETDVQYFSTEGMQKGMYRARMKWTMDGEEFYIEQAITL